MNKYFSIRNWKKYGVISDDFDKLYEEHMNILNCELCNIEFDDIIFNNKRCLDHNHETGLYRQTICHKCNKHFDRKINKNNILNHQYIHYSHKKKTYVYRRTINKKITYKSSKDLIKLIAFSFIQILKYQSKLT